MSSPVADTPLRAGSEEKARDTTEVRGPSRVPKWRRMSLSDAVPQGFEGSL